MRILFQKQFISENLDFWNPKKRRNSRPSLLLLLQFYGKECTIRFCDHHNQSSRSLNLLPQEFVHGTLADHATFCIAVWCTDTVEIYLDRGTNQHDHASHIPGWNFHPTFRRRWSQGDSNRDPFHELYCHLWYHCESDQCCCGSTKGRISFRRTAIATKEGQDTTTHYGRRWRPNCVCKHFKTWCSQKPKERFVFQPVNAKICVLLWKWFNDSKNKIFKIFIQIQRVNANTNR